MIGFTKLLCNTATVSEVLRTREVGDVPPRFLQFSDANRPLVVWNMTNRCNLRCRHCYIEAEDKAYSYELTKKEALNFIEDLGSMKVPVLLFSGGEPLLRQDIFELGERAALQGIRPVISTNGTLINKTLARAIKEAGFQYVGVSLDGMPKTHDGLRCKDGAFDMALKGIRNCLEEGVRTGVRFTINRENAKELPELLDLVAREGIPRFCMYHLVYAGRGKEMKELDLDVREKRELIDLLIDKTLELTARGVEIEILTTDNHADGVYLWHYLKSQNNARLKEVIQLLNMHGGCSAGTKFANVDPKGDVHPCQFWQDYTLGNVKETPFSRIWTGQDPLLAKLREKKKHLKGRCARCSFNQVCGGCRIRAKEVFGDIWEEDPACYLTEEEIASEVI